MIFKSFLRLAVFLCTLTFALLVARVLLAPPLVEVEVQPLAPRPVAATAPASVDYKVQVVAFERDGGRLDTRLSVARVPGRPAPASIWVWTYFFAPQSALVWTTTPVEVRAPFAQGDRATLVVSAPCSTCRPVDMTKDTNYYARVFVSTEPLPADYERNTRFDLSIKSATPVVVSHVQHD